MYIGYQKYVTEAQPTFVCQIIIMCGFEALVIIRHNLKNINLISNFCEIFKLIEIIYSK